MERLQFNEGWSFGESGKEKAPVLLPHDAMQQQGRNADAPSGKGGAYFLGGCYEYEKTFLAPAEWKDQDVILEFEGVYPSARVCLNGKEIGGCRYGYTLFRIPLEGLRYGEENVLTVEADNSKLPNSRWYTGAGIYRPVWLLVGAKTHIAPDGIRVTTKTVDPAEGKADAQPVGKAQIAVDVEMAPAADAAEVNISIFDGEEKIAEASGEHAVIDLLEAKLWDDEHPYLYRCEVTATVEGVVVDQEKTTFGIRTLSWSKEGFFVNGRSVLLKGGCMHHDNGILGARSYEKSEWRRMKRMKEFGFNAIRSSHNPMCKAALDACDALGIYVMDEAWDMWDKAKSPYDYAADFPTHYEEDICSMVAKDYNHPSMIMYSIGNEVTEPAKTEGVALAEKLVEKFHEEDDTRPVTAGINLTLLLMAALEDHPEIMAQMAAAAGGDSAAAKPEGEEKKEERDVSAMMAPDTTEMNSTAYNKMVSEMGNRMTMAAATPAADKFASPVLDLLDIAGYNYAVSRYEMEAELHPDRVLVGSETYTYELAKTWPLVEKYPHVIGDFMWTAWDYLGEVGIASWSYDPEDRSFEKPYPWLLSDAGAIDLLGNDTAEAGAAAVVWGARKTPYIGVCPVNHPGLEANRAIWRGSNALPYWSYQGCDGNDAEVEVYTDACEVELFVNGKSVGRQKPEDKKAVFMTAYESGECRAVAYDESGNAVSESSLRSAEGKTMISITPEESAVKKGDILYLDISLTGENGQVECNKDTKLTVTVEGGELLAFGSANPKTTEDYLAGCYATYYGRSQAVVLATGDEVVVKVSGDPLEAAESRIPVLS